MDTKELLNLKSLPKEVLTEEFILDALGAPWPYGNGNLSIVPNECLSPKICMAAVKKTGWNLGHVPEHMQTLDIIEAAIKQTEWAIVFVKGTEMRRERADHLCASLCYLCATWFALFYQATTPPQMGIHWPVT